MRVAVVSLALALSTIPGAGALGILGLDLGLPAQGEVLVGYEEGALAAVTALVETLGGTVLGANEDIRVLTASVPNVATALPALDLAPLVEFVETNDATKLQGSQWNGAQWNGAQWNGAQWNGAQWNGASGSSSDPGVMWQWGLAPIGATSAWNLSAGARGATLCVLDSGIAWDHPDLDANVVAGFNAIHPGASAYDDAGHGTHVAGIAAAEIGNGFGVAGVGNVQIAPVKVLGADGTGREDDLALGIVWCANHDAEVALMALGVDKQGPTLQRAIAYAVARDVLLVASAGNGGCSNCVGYPASHPHVIAVSAIGQDLRPASFSSKGPEVDLAAPGVEILGPFLDDRFVYGSGTSQAAAFVAGAAALVRDVHPELDAAEARQALADSARDLGLRGVDPSYGRGLVNVAGALAEAR